jgi:aspergillopepsin I
VFSPQLPQEQKEGHSVYKPSVYSKKSLTNTWAIRYADGSSASGAVYYDVVGIEGIWVIQQAVEVATNISSNLARGNGLDGVLGLGFSKLNKGISTLTKHVRSVLVFDSSNNDVVVRPERENTFFENAKLQLKVPLFAAILKQDALGSYDFGFVNESRYTGELNYVNIDSSRGHWSFKFSGYDLGSGEITNDPLEGVIGK